MTALLAALLLTACADLRCKPRLSYSGDLRHPIIDRYQFKPGICCDF